MKFIKINNRILDYDCYREDVKLLNRIIASDLKDCLGKLGFVRKGDSFYNSSLDLEIKITVEKKSTEVFV